MESHYCRKDTKKRYLDSTLSVPKMYDLFKTKYFDEPDVPKDNVYRHIFGTEYNLDFFHPSKDKCLICKNYENAVGLDKQQMEKSYSEHIKRKDEAYAAKQADKNRANEDKTFVSATFDLQKVLQIPVSDVGPLYYSRKLRVFNLTVYESAIPNNAYCFTWNEINGKRGSSEIGTALLNWIQTLPKHVKEISVFSDTCGGQNRNQHVAALFLHIIENFDFNLIEHKFMEKGHSKLEADSMHSAIEYAQKNVSIFSMRDWLTVFAMARSNRKHKNKKSYIVKESTFNDFIDLKSLTTETIQNRIKDSKGDIAKC